MPSVGETLRAARLNQGLDLADLAVRTKISRKFLEAIEADDRQQLPSGFFYKSWVLQYASALKVDEAKIATQVENLLKDEPPVALPGQESTRIAGSMRPARMQRHSAGGWQKSLASVALLLTVMVGCSGLYAWWHNGKAQADVAQAFKAFSKIADASTPAASVPSPSLTATPQAPSKTSPVGDPDRLVSATPGEVQIELAATEQTWISITPDGKQAFSGILQPSEVRTVGAHETARIRVGNAGGLTVRVNGKPVGKIGPEGQVRIILIDKTGVKIQEPVPVAPPNTAAPINNRVAVGIPSSAVVGQ